MNNVADLEHDPEPINRAIYWLAHLSWTDPDNFETLQELAGELQGQVQQQSHIGLPLTTSVVKKKAVERSAETSARCVRATKRHRSLKEI